MNYKEKIIKAFYDSIVFALMTNLIYYTIFYTIIDLPFTYFWQLLTPSFAFWLVFAALNLNKKVLLISSSLFVFIAAVLSYIYFENIRIFLTEFNHWLFTTFAYPEVLSEKPFGIFVKYIALSIIILAMLIAYFLRNYPKFTIGFGIFISILFLIANIFYPKIDYKKIYILTLAVFSLFIISASYKNNETQSFLKFFSKKLIAFICVFLVFVPVSLAVSFDHREFPFQEIFKDFTNEVVGTTTSSSIITSKLGGDNIQSSRTQFKFKSYYFAYLKTDVYDTYTGNSFEKSDILQNSNREMLSNDNFASLHSDGLYDVTIEMVDYNSKSLPVPSYFLGFQSQDNFQNNLTATTHDEVKSSKFFTNEVFQYVHPGNVSHIELGIDKFGEDNDANYLGLPQVVTPRTIKLAQNLKEECLIEFEDRFGPHAQEGVDQDFLNQIISAYFVEYLSDNYIYTLTPNEVEGVDFVDSFLFEHKEGYCTSFASSLFVLLRAVDIPCLYAVGFHPVYTVEQLDKDGFYKVSELDMHAWVELHQKDLILNLDCHPMLYSSVEKTPSPTPTISPSPTSQTTITPTVTTAPTATKAPETVDIKEKELPLWVIPSLLLLCIIIIFFVYKNYLIKRKLNSNQTKILYSTLLKLLKLLNYTRNQGETVREFLGRIDELNQIETEKLTEEIERYLYFKDESINENLQICVKILNNLVKSKSNIFIYLIRF